jgi:hypothetical protein
MLSLLRRIAATLEGCVVVETLDGTCCLCWAPLST